MLHAVLAWIGEFLAYLFLSAITVAIAYILGVLILAALTWPFRHLPETSSWRIDEDFPYHFKGGLILWATSIGLALLKMVCDRSRF